MNQKTSGVSQTRALAVVSTIFFLWGFLTCLNDILIPHLRAIFSLTYAQSALVQFTFFGAYFVVSIPAGKVLSRIGYKNSISLGLLIAAVGSALFVPAARWVSYDFFLLALFILASGITLLQVAANPYVTLLGPARSASSRLNLAQALNSLGTTVAPAFGGILILSATVLSADQLGLLPAAEQTAYKAAQAESVQGPYLFLALLLLALALFMYLFRLPNFPGMEHDSAASDRATFGEALAKPQVLLGVAGLFLYVGAEVSIGSFLINFISLPTVTGISESAAAGYVAIYWGGAMVGRFLGAALMRRIDAGKLLALFALVAAVLVGFTLLAQGWLAVWLILAVGLFNSIMFPTIFSLGVRDLGPLTGKASSLLIMGIVGGAIIPILHGSLADRIGLHQSFALPLVCYLFIAYYGVRFRERHLA